MATTSDGMCTPVDAILQEPPNDLEAEQCVIGACLYAPQPVEWLASCNDPEGLFYRELHKQIVSAIMHLWCEGLPVDIATVAAELLRRGQLEACGGKLYLEACVAEMPTPTHAKRYIAVLERCRCSREMIRLGNVIAESGYANLEDPQAEALKLAYSLEVAANSAVDYERQIEPLGRHIERDFLPAIEERIGAETIPGIPTGWTEFDRTHCPGGLQRGRVTALMAARKVGKSTIATHLALNAALNSFKVGLASLEMSKSEVALKMSSWLSDIPAVDIALGRLREGEWNRYKAAARQLASLPIYVSDQRGVDVHRVIAWARRLKREHGLDMLIVDYLQLLEPHLDSRQSLERNVSDATRRFVVEAQRLDAHIVLLAQMNQEGFAKWSGQTNDDCHVNWRVARANEKGEPEVDGDYFKFHIEQRFGVSGVVPRLYRYHGATGKIEETNINPLPYREEDAECRRPRPMLSQPIRSTR